MKHVVSITLLLLGLSVSWGQTEREIDSLRQLLKGNTNVEESVEINEQLFVAYLYTYPDSADRYRKNIREISEKNNYTNGEYLYQSLSGRYQFAKSDIDSAFYHIEKASKIAEELQNKSYLADCYKKIGVIYNIRRNDSLSKKYAKLALFNAKQTDDWRTLSSIYILLGNQHFERAEYPEALTYYLKLDSIYTSQNELDKSLAVAYTNIGMIYSELRNQEAVPYIEKSIDIYQTLGLEEGVHYGELALGTHYDLLQENEKAIEHLLKAEEYYESYGDLLILGSIYGRLGETYLEIDNFADAEKYLLKASAIPESSQRGIRKVTNQTNLGDLYWHRKQYQKAIIHFEKALELIKEDGKEETMRMQLLNVYQGLYGAYKDSKDFKNALTALENQMELETIVQNSQNELEVEELNKKYQTDKQQQEIELLTSQSELAEQKSKNQQNLFVGSISVLGLAFITLFFLFRNKQKTNQRLKELEAAKSKFFANISHEFRTPLTLISGPVAHQLSKKGLSVDDKTDLGLIQRNANRLLKLVNQILDLSKIEAGSRKLRVSKGNMELFMTHLVEPFQYRAQQTDVVFNSQIDVANKAWFDRDVVDKIVTNLLSNAIKYNQQKGQIQFKAVQLGQQLNITTMNQNNDLSEKELPLLFDRFYQTNTMNQGFGIGLSLVQELANLAKGTVRAYKPNDATVAFEVTLPVTKNAFSKAEIVAEDELLSSNKTDNADIGLEPDMEDKYVEESSLPVLLVVDDNSEIRLFIKTLFKKEYKILEAENGKDGENIALETIPDLIISDVMMPVKNGIELSNTLKTDERTSHIPIILLTAKSGEENELEGLKTGADAYMVKPFKEEKLRVVIDKLIATRTAIQEKFGNQPFFKAKNIELTHVDTELLNRIQHILDTELTNPEFNTQTFAEQVGLSRMHLHRKLKALTGLSTTEFIRSQRLKLAAQLLEEGHSSIAEVAYATGFNQPAYFSTVFKQEFGHSPSEYVESN
ncbi:response regulator [Flagellimonas algicola]|uniref:histidine kinase n=1 Tax=Flagellimonas algicola TaxID=2583815 RepID=A0ABY2WMF7_9FLAO|nr:response regulator [Allomuricauda algicola]TMU56063.1 tetratricopeptide repeat protein [Allomuricauda algicola]